VIDLDLIKRRTLALLRQLDAERPYGWQTDLAREVWGDVKKQSHINQMLNEKKGAGIKTAQELARGMGLSMAFFTDPTLGDAPDYRRWVGVKAPAITTLDTSTAQEMPTSWEEDMEWAIGSAKLTGAAADEFRRRRRSIGFAIGRTALMALAEEVLDPPTDRAVADPPKADVIVDVVGEIEAKGQ
jgi:hypothetical protein